MQPARIARLRNTAPLGQWGQWLWQDALPEPSKLAWQSNPAMDTEAVPTPTAGPILVVEDDVAVQTMLFMALEDANYPVELARNGVEALAQLDTIRPRLILLDMRMPVMDGTTFLRTLYSQANYPIPPVIVMTAYREIDPAALEFGLPAINKPMNIESLLRLIEHYTART